jgi:hypothetical protein
MLTCPNCGATFSCGCQRRAASDGKQCCSQCIVAYEAKLKASGKKDDQALTPVQQAYLTKSS